ncbi:MAG: hypothetical protein ACXWUP_01605 [Allosphingosinicella sp.]
MAEEALTTAAAFRELQGLLRLAATDVSPQRLAATRYTLCRDLLVRSPYRPSLPGFLLQCLTLYRFQEFIHLYDPAVEARLAFLDDAFPLNGVASAPVRPSYDAWIDRDF